MSKPLICYQNTGNGATLRTLSYGVYETFKLQQAISINCPEARRATWAFGISSPGAWITPERGCLQSDHSYIRPANPRDHTRAPFGSRDVIRFAGFTFCKKPLKRQLRRFQYRLRQRPRRWPRFPPAFHRQPLLCLEAYLQVRHNPCSSPVL